jgi:aminoglycoside phosphotransferase (APT) family kinase protein
VDQVEWPGGAPAVVRSAKVERLTTRYDGLVDFGVELEKQVMAAALLRDHGVPAPDVLAWFQTTDPEAEPSWMVLERIEHEAADWSDAALQSELGDIARRIHSIAPPAAFGTPPPASRWERWMTDRILARVAAAAAYVPVPADRDRVRSAVEAVAQAREPHAVHLLHMDLRPPNVAIRDGKIVSVFDLANTLRGDPWLELGRIRGCGLLSPAFLHGYGGRDLDGEFEAALDVYELDLSALLVVVSREEFDDPTLHATMSYRTRVLLERILNGGDT